MINSIIYGISKALHAEFGDDYEIYMEEVRQGLKEPCFLISCINPVTRLFLGKRYFRQNMFCILYFPSTENIKTECNETAEKLFWCLECIDTSEGMIRGKNMKYRVIDGVLNFFVDYDCFIYKIENTTSMETLESNTGVKG